MRCRALALIVLAGCTPVASQPAPPPNPWVYPPAPVALLGEPIGKIGRSQAPQHVRSLGIAGTAKIGLRTATPWTVPGDKARAVIYGVEGSLSAIELIDVDDGRVVWRDTKACAGPVVGVTEESIVCADAQGVRGVGMDGKQKYKIEAAYLAMTEERVVVEGPGEVIVHDADSGNELTRLKLPANVTADTVIAACGDTGRELFVVGRDGKLARIAEVPPPPPKPVKRGQRAPVKPKPGPAIVWATPIGRIDEIDACVGNRVIVREAGVGGGTLVALDRANGKVVGRVANVHGYWKARDGSDGFEIASDGGTSVWPRDLVAASAQTSTLQLGELLATRGEKRLVRATPSSAVLLDRDGIAGYVPFAAAGAVLGDTAIVGASWTADFSVRRIAIPPRYRKALRLAPPRPGVALPAELRDLPEAKPPENAPIENADSGKHAVVDVVIDARESAVLYTLQLEAPDDERGVPGIAAVDLAKRAWRWQRAQACGIGEAVGIAAARDVIVCASRTRTTATVGATDRDGNAKWQWESDHVDRIEAAGDVVLAFDADRVTVLDAATGKVRWRITSDDGGRVRAAALAIGNATYVVAYERGRIVARVIGGFPLWSIEVNGVVASIAASADGALVALEDGDAYRIAMTGEATPLPGLNLEWRAAGDLVAATTPGGPIPGTPLPPVTGRLRVLKPLLEKPPADVDPHKPPIWTPIPPPPPLGDSWQLTLYELAGGLRARNDYGLFPPIAPARERGPAGSPFVVASSPGLRDVLVIDPRTGDPMRRVQLAEDAAPGLVFGTIVDGTPVAGAVLQQPLRVVLF